MPDNNIEWGQAAVNNSNDFGKAKANSTNNFGAVYDSSPSGDTNIAGGQPVVSITYSASAFCADASDPTPTIQNNAGVGTFSSTAGLVFISTTTGEVDIDASTVGSYLITYTDTDSATATFNLTINALPTVVVNASAGTICNGESTILTASGASTYVWNDGNTDNPRTVSPTTTTLFTATGTDSNGCTSSGGTTITVNALPTVEITGTLTYCAGASTTLDAGSFVSYLWSNGETTQTISATAGNYTVTVTDSNGCSNTSAQVTVTELALPTVAISGTLSYCAGSNTTLTATAGLSSYLWSSGETTQSITATAASYTVTGTDANGCSTTSSSVTVTETALDNAGFSYSASSYEPTDADPTPTITGLTGGTFSGTTGLVINSTTGEIDLSASTVATHTITYDTTSSGSSVCPNTSTQNVEIAVAGIANNYSMNFDSASSDYIEVQDSTTNTFGFANKTGSISAWIKINDLSAERPIASKRETGNPGKRQWMLLVGTDAKVKFYAYNTDSQSDLTTSISTLSTGVWYHITVTLTTTETKIYIDGSLDITGSNTYSSIQNDQADLNIGRRGANADIRYFDGNIDELGIWNTELTSTQVSEIYNGTGTNTTKDLTTVSGSNLIYWNRMGD
jgi:hypothetical protein